MTSSDATGLPEQFVDQKYVMFQDNICILIADVPRTLVYVKLVVNVESVLNWQFWGVVTQIFIEISLKFIPNKNYNMCQPAN